MNANWAQSTDPSIKPPPSPKSRDIQISGCPFIKRECHACNEPETTYEQLRYCSRCKSPVILYCSRRCQESDYTQHKKNCKANNAIFAFAGEPVERNIPISQGFTKVKGGLELPVSKPFHRLRARKWLHKRPEADVFKLLIDVYRMRMADAHAYMGFSDLDGIYGDGVDGSPGLYRFLKLLEMKPDLAPDWWSSDKATKCVAFGSSTSSSFDNWSDLAYAIQMKDVVRHYGDSSMPDQLRLFGEQVYGNGIRGLSAGKGVLAVRMAAERH